MEVSDVKKIYEKLPTQSKFAEIYYLNQCGNKESRPGYITEIFDMAWDDIPPEHQLRFGDGKEHPMPPYMALGRVLDRNSVPIEPKYIRIEDIIEVRPVAVVPLKE